ncbi:MAG: cell division protein FtsL [Deltaproteobacteria bacterium RBG_13_61_14]|nr:MAG: cell division protein FtsL [Deltaproteobacteria bacterium RBG_13_61_14]
MTATVAGRAIRSGTLSRQRVRQGWVLGPVLLTVVVLVAATLFYVWCRLQAVRVGYEQSRTAETLQQMEKVNEELRGEVARLKSPERIERLARERLGLKYPSPEQIRILDPWGE